MDNPQPNAFATGRNPENAAVAVTTGLLNTLSRDEVAGVIAHELAHIKNHDTLIMTITATIAGAISMLAQFGMFFGGNRNNNNGFGIIGTLAMVILAPIAAMLVQMAISRTREYSADRLGAMIQGTPVPLCRGAGADLQRRATDPERERGAESRHRAHVHHQSADRRPRLGQPVRDPSLDREPDRRAAAACRGNGPGRRGQPRRRSAPADRAERPLGCAARRPVGLSDPRHVGIAMFGCHARACAERVAASSEFVRHEPHEFPIFTTGAAGARVAPDRRRYP